MALAAVRSLYHPIPVPLAAVRSLYHPIPVALAAERSFYITPSRLLWLLNVHFIPPHLGGFGCCTLKMHLPILMPLVAVRSKAVVLLLLVSVSLFIIAPIVLCP